jgi:predicted pyridoxine 5'-phosphate oxidase superfamily flavin-nucleotide-binding protein
MTYSNEPVILSGEVVRDSKNAYLFRVAGTDKFITNWVPKAVCKWDPIMMQMIMPRWCARVKFRLVKTTESLF